MNLWRDKFWDLFHIFIAQQQFHNELMLLITYDKDIGIKRKYDGFINAKQEELQRRRQAVDAIVGTLPKDERVS